MLTTQLENALDYVTKQNLQDLNVYLGCKDLTPEVIKNYGSTLLDSAIAADKPGNVMTLLNLGAKFGTQSWQTLEQACSRSGDQNKFQLIKDEFARVEYQKILAIRTFVAETKFYLGAVGGAFLSNPLAQCAIDLMNGDNKDKPCIDYFTDQFSVKNLASMSFGYGVAFLFKEARTEIVLGAKLASDIFNSLFNNSKLNLWSIDYAQNLFKTIATATVQSSVSKTAIEYSGLMNHYHDNPIGAGFLTSAISAVVKIGIQGILLGKGAVDVEDNQFIGNANTTEYSDFTS